LLVEVGGEGGVVELEDGFALLDHGSVGDEPLDLQAVLPGARNLDLGPLHRLQLTGQQVPLHQRPAVNSEIGGGGARRLFGAAEKS